MSLSWFENMAIIKIKGYDIHTLTIRDSYDRRAVQYKNNIIETLKKLDLTEDDVEITQDVSAFKNAPASATWYMDGHRLYYSYKIANKYVENLYIVFKVIELEVNALLSGEKTLEEFTSSFSEEDDIEEERKQARITLGVDPDVVDMDVINAKYKELAKKNHPDMDGGDTEKFKAINRAHKMLKRELQ